MSELKTRPTVSVCVVTYNQRAYISDCLLSVILQSCDADLEILVGDDCSSDGTSEIVSKIAAAYPGRLTVPKRDRNLGVFENYRDLVRRATGAYIAHLDGDDYWMPGKLLAQLKLLDEHPDCAAVYTNAHIINEAGELIAIFNNRQPQIFDTNYLLDGGNFLNHSSILYRASLKPCLLDIEDDFIDYRLHLRLSQHGDLGYLNQDLVAYRTNTATSMIKTIPEKVDTLYWEAICDPEIRSASPASQTRSGAIFYARILYDAMRRVRFSYAIRWAKKIRAEAGHRSLQIFARSLFYCILVAGRSVRRKIAGCLSGSSIYPRFER